MSSAVQAWSEVLMDNYGTPPIGLVRGAGSRVWDEEGREMIDCLGGIAVNSLGHAHPAIIDAVTRQLRTLGHVSNLCASSPAVEVARELISRFAGGDREVTADTRVFFCNSGAEANEAAFKIARLTGRRRILAAVNGFHGRTMGSLAMTGQPAKRAPFEPMPSGVEFFPFGDLDYLHALVESNPQDVAMIIVEPIQGETGVVPAPAGFLTGIRRLCDDHGILFVADEVQTGIGRTGDFFAVHHEGVIPDIITMAKGLAGGMPIGACLAHGEAARLLTPGTHGTTFGGNPVCCAAASAVLSVIDEEFLRNVKVKSQTLIKGFSALPGVGEVRGRGLMLGVVLTQPIAKELVARAPDHGLIMNAPAEDVLRITPALTITEEDIAEVIERLSTLLIATQGVHP